MKHIRYVTQLGMPECTHDVYHVVRFEGYRATVSAGAFFHGMRCHETHKKAGRCWPSHDRHDHYLYIKSGIWQDDVSVIEHATIWDFYKHIGWDYKKQRYFLP